MKNELITAFANDLRIDGDHYGLKTIEIDGGEYALAVDYDDAVNACEEYIKETVWAFNPCFLASHIKDLDAETIEGLPANARESFNAVWLHLIDDFDDFVSDAISADGLGHFLSPYDGDMIEIEGTDVLLFRIN